MEIIFFHSAVSNFLLNCVCCTFFSLSNRAQHTHGKVTASRAIIMPVLNVYTKKNTPNSTWINDKASFATYYLCFFIFLWSHSSSSSCNDRPIYFTKFGPKTIYLHFFGFGPVVGCIDQYVKLCIENTVRARKKKNPFLHKCATLVFIANTSKSITCAPRLR